MVSFRHLLCLCFSDRSLSPSHRLLATICQSHESGVPRAPNEELNRHSRASMPADRREARPWPDRSWGRSILWNPGKPQVVSVVSSPPYSHSGKWLVRTQAVFYGKLPQSPCDSVFCRKTISETSLATLVNRESLSSGAEISRNNRIRGHVRTRIGRGNDRALGGESCTIPGGCAHFWQFTSLRAARRLCWPRWR